MGACSGRAQFLTLTVLERVGAVPQFKDEEGDLTQGFKNLPTGFKGPHPTHQLCPKQDAPPLCVLSCPICKENRAAPTRP